MGVILNRIKARRPVIGGILDVLIGEKREDVATYTDGTQETIRYDGGILRDRAVLSALVTGVITTFNLTADTDTWIQIITGLANIVGLVLTAVFAKQKVDAN